MTYPDPEATLEGGYGGDSHAEMHGRTLGIYENVKHYGAVGDGTADDTAAIQAAIDAVVAAKATFTGGTIFFPPGRYKVTSTFDLTGVNAQLHFLGGNMSAGLLPGLMPPGVDIDGRSITTGPVFYYDGAGSTANHRYENLSVRGYNNAFYYLEAANVRMVNVAARSQNIADPDNCAVLMENTFWCWYDNCAFYQESTSRPAVILRGNATNINAESSGLQRFTHTIFYGGGIKVEQLKVPASAGNLFLLNCLSENCPQPFIEFTEGASVNSAWRFYAMQLINIEHADTGAGTVPLVKVNADNLVIDSPIVMFALAPGNRCFQMHAGSITSARIMGANRNARFIVDANGDPYANASYLTDKEWGFDLIAEESSGQTGTGIYSGGEDGPALRMGIAGEAKSGVGLSASSARGLMFGAGGASGTYDTNLYRSAADTLKTDDALVVGGALTASKAFLMTPITLTDTDPVSVNAALGNVFTWQANDNRTVSAPTNPTAGQVIHFVIRSNKSGTLTITWDAVYHLAGAFTAPTTSNTRVISFVYAGSVWREISRTTADST